MLRNVEDRLIVATGHRLNKLGGYTQKVKDRVTALAAAVLTHHKPTRVVTGMAIGWDQAIAEACVQLNIPFTAVVPFKGQELRWNEKDQQHYHQLLQHANQVLYTMDVDANKREISSAIAAKALNDRNKHMLRLLKNNLERGGGGHVAALHDGTRGGTNNCITAANEWNLPVKNYWNSWQKHAGL